MDKNDFTEMKVDRLVIDTKSHAPIVLLIDEATGALLPIWIGIFEAHAIATRLERTPATRPMTHDLLRSFFDVTKGMVERVEIHDLVDNTYFARIHFFLNQQSFAIDSRPSDAIALALRTISPIYVADHVLEQSKVEPSEKAAANQDNGDSEESEESKWDEILRNYTGEGDNTKYN